MQLAKFLIHLGRPLCLPVIGQNIIDQSKTPRCHQVVYQGLVYDAFELSF